MTRKAVKSMLLRALCLSPHPPNSQIKLQVGMQNKEETTDVSTMFKCVYIACCWVNRRVNRLQSSITVRVALNKGHWDANEIERKNKKKINSLALLPVWWQGVPFVSTVGSGSFDGKNHLKCLPLLMVAMKGTHKPSLSLTVSWF